MLKRAKLFSALFCLFCSSLYANCSPCFNTCEPNCCKGEWLFRGEFLYFLPSFDDTYFVIQSDIDIALLDIDLLGTRLNNDFSFHPGYRIGAAYAFGNCSGAIEAYYTHLSANQSLTVNDGFLFATVGTSFYANVFGNYSGLASSHLDFSYERVDGFYRYPFWHTVCTDFNALFGVEYAYMDLKENFTNFEPGIASGVLDRQATTWGIGPQFGFNFDYLLWKTCRIPGNLSFSVNTSGSLLVSKNNMNIFNSLQVLFNGESNSILLDVSDENTWRIIPAWHLRAALNYGACFSCWKGSLEIGYEFTSYFRSLTRYAFATSANGLTFTDYFNFSLQGLYLAAEVAF
jgi:hypothetical protein